MQYDISFQRGQAISPPPTGAEAPAARGSLHKENLNIDVIVHIRDTRGRDVETKVVATLAAFTDTVASELTKSGTLGLVGGTRERIYLPISLSSQTASSVAYITASKLDVLFQALDKPRIQTIEAESTSALLTELAPITDDDEGALSQAVDVAAASVQQKMLKWLEYQEASVRLVDSMWQELERPVGSYVQGEADRIYQELKQVPVHDVTTLQANNPQAYADYQLARTEGSNTLTSAVQLNTKLTNWQNADTFVRELALRKEPLTRDRICEINEKLNEGLPTAQDCGRVRSKSINEDIHTGGAQAFEYLEYPNGPQVKQAMDRFMGWFDAQIQECDAGRANPIVTAALAYQRAVSIHPFNDGNGRTTRLIMDYVLQRYELPPAALGEDIRVANFGVQHQGSDELNYDIQNINDRNDIVADMNDDAEPKNVVFRIAESLRNSYQKLGLIP